MNYSKQYDNSDSYDKRRDTFANRLGESREDLNSNDEEQDEYGYDKGKFHSPFAAQTR